eukprot:5129705-Pyramimonas_sp.AAC.1
MLLGWQKQVHRWMKDTLGAVDHARTCARQIQDEIAFNLRKDIMGSKHRTRLKVKVVGWTESGPRGGGQLIVRRRHVQASAASHK